MESETETEARKLNALQRHPVITFFTLTLAMSWGLYSLLTVPGGLGLIPSDSLVFGIAAFFKQFSPTVAGLITVLVVGGKPGLRAITKSALRWRTRGRWYAVVLIGLPAVLVSASLGYGLVTGDPLLSESAGASLVFAIVAIILFAGISEELFGWRGYALPTMLKRMGPVTASIIIGVAWMLWHVPPWGLIADGVSLGQLLNGVLGTVGLSLVMTWVFLGSGSALLAGVVLHGTYNATASFVTGPAWVGGDWAVPALGLIAAVVLMLGQRGSAHRGPADAHDVPQPG